MNKEQIIVDRKALLKIHHDLRTPLNALLGFIEIYCNDKHLTKEERQSYLKIIKDKTSELYKISTILNILDT